MSRDGPTHSLADVADPKETIMSAQPHHVVIAGGGVAGMEALLALHELAGHRVQVTVVSRRRQFLYRPVTVAEAFDRGEARVYPLAEMVDDAGGKLVWDKVDRVDPGSHTLLTAAGEWIEYDSLIVATGAVTHDPLPGALCFRGRPDVAALREQLEMLAAGEARSIAFTLPSERMWALPVYELALLTAGYLRERGSEAEVWVVTPEEAPLELFGPAAARALEPMLAARGVQLRTSTRAALVRDRALVMMGGAELYVDSVVTLPQLEGPRMPGLPCDQHGFIPVDDHGRVSGLQDVYAAGDVTSFPLKQGGLAAQQADAVAEAIAASLEIPIEPRPFTPVLRGLLITGGAPLYLRAEPQRLPRESSVAIEAHRAPRLRAREASAAAGQPLWWPPAKIAGRYLGPFLATARPQPLSSDLLEDRVAVSGPPVLDAEFQDALELALLLADCDARWGDFAAALDALDAAEALQGALPAEYEAKRRRWKHGQHASV
jgi:sulfide:quinone oxidoreductase